MFGFIGKMSKLVARYMSWSIKWPKNSRPVITMIYSAVDSQHERKLQKQGAGVQSDNDIIPTMPKRDLPDRCAVEGIGVVGSVSSRVVPIPRTIKKMTYCSVWFRQKRGEPPKFVIPYRQAQMYMYHCLGWIWRVSIKCEYKTRKWKDKQTKALVEEPHG